MLDRRVNSYLNLFPILQISSQSDLANHSLVWSNKSKRVVNSCGVRIFRLVHVFLGNSDTHEWGAIVNQGV